MKQQGNASGDCKIFNQHKNTRRDFLKTCGAATAGGLTTLLWPGGARAATGRHTALEVLAGTPGTLSEELYWNAVRRKFVLKPGLLHMNTGTEGSMPRFVLENLNDDFRRFASNPMQTLWNDIRCNGALTNVVPSVAEFLGAETGEIVLTSNTTEGLGWVANGLDLEAGDEVLVSTQFAPYNAC